MRSALTGIDFDGVADADRLGEQGWVVIDGWLGHDHAALVHAELVRRAAAGEFVPAGSGQGKRDTQQTARGDRVCWFDAGAVDAAAAVVDDAAVEVSAGGAVAAALVRLRALRRQLNESCFLSLRNIEVHGACYEPGTAYAAHKDAFAGDSRRVISFVCYLNEGWRAADGGCLRLHTAPALDIEPLFDRLLIFQSRLIEHEVMTVFRRRFTLTGWMGG